MNSGIYQDCSSIDEIRNSLYSELGIDVLVSFSLVYPDHEYEIVYDRKCYVSDDEAEECAYTDCNESEKEMRDTVVRCFEI